MNEDKRRILTSLMYKPKQSFNELWNGDGKSNKFNYHLKALLTGGLVVRDLENYKLSVEGKKLVKYFPKEVDLPYVGVLLVIFNETGDKVLKFERKKEPFYGYYGFPGGQMNSRDYIYECAKRKALEDLGIECEFTLKGLFSSKTYSGETLIHNHQMFVLKGEIISGKPAMKNRKGEIIKWINSNGIPKTKKFPEHDSLMEIVSSKNFKWVEMDRNMDESGSRFI